MRQWDGTFKEPVYYHAGSDYSTWAFTAGDFNSDGKTDFIVGTSRMVYARGCLQFCWETETVPSNLKRP